MSDQRRRSHSPPRARLTPSCVSNRRASSWRVITSSGDDSVSCVPSSVVLFVCMRSARHLPRSHARSRQLLRRAGRQHRNMLLLRMGSSWLMDWYVWFRAPAIMPREFELAPDGMRGHAWFGRALRTHTTEGARRGTAQDALRDSTGIADPLQERARLDEFGMTSRNPHQSSSRSWFSIIILSLMNTHG